MGVPISLLSPCVSHEVAWYSVRRCAFSSQVKLPSLRVWWTMSGPSPSKINLKVKDKVHPRTGHEEPDGEYRYSSTLSLTSALVWGLGVQHHAPTAFLPEMTRHPLYMRVVRPQGRLGQVRKISPPTWIRSADRPARTVPSKTNITNVKQIVAAVRKTCAQWDARLLVERNCVVLFCVLFYSTPFVNEQTH